MASDTQKAQEQTLNIAVVGCSHGELNTIYHALAQQEEDLDLKIDLLLCCGDFQVY